MNTIHKCDPCGRKFRSYSDLSEHLMRNPLCQHLRAHPLTGGAPASTGPTPEGVEIAEFASYDLSGGGSNVMYDVSGLVTDTQKYPAPVYCPSCGKCFSVERSLARHLERFPACANRVMTPAPVAAMPPLNEWVDDLLVSATLRVLDSGVECRWCQREYGTRSALHKHLKSSVACNTSATEAFRAKVEGAACSTPAPVR